MLKKTIHYLLEESARKFPQKTALIFEDKRYSYAQFQEASQKIASFIAQQTRFQDRVILLLPNSPEFIAAYFGVLKTGRIVVPTDIAVSKENLTARINLVKPTLLFTNNLLYPRVKTDFPGLACEEINKVLQSERAAGGEKKRISENDTASLLFTTGTTGQPKGVIVRHKNAVAAVGNMIKFLKYSKDSIDVNALPLTHSFGLGNIHTIFAVGGTVVLHKNFINLQAILEDMERYKAVSFSATPPIFELLSGVAAKLFKKYNRSLRFILTNSAPVPPPTVKKIIKLAPWARFFTYYGLTEASRSTFMEFNKNPGRLTSVGRAAHGIKIAVVDENGKHLGIEKTGELYIKGLNVANGYWKNKEATRSRIKNGWLATGDFGYFDKRGYLFLTGRKDDIINIGGEKVYPHEIEEVLRRHKFVKEVAVIGVKDEFLGEVPKAVVVAARKNLEIKKFSGELQSLCRRELKSYKVPRIFEFVDSLPKTSSGKLQKKFLK